jgi:hypothetical protein
MQNTDYPNGLESHRGAGFSLRRTSVRLPQPLHCAPEGGLKPSAD